MRRPKPERSYDEMVQQAQAAIDEQNQAIEQRKRDFEQLQQTVIPHTVIPHKGVPPVIGDCIYDK
jgi:hypothetical protein